MTKNELREAIIKNISKIKNSVTLDELCVLTDLLQRRWDKEKYTTLTDDEWEKSILIRGVLRSKNPRSVEVAHRLFVVMESKFGYEQKHKV